MDISKQLESVISSIVENVQTRVSQQVADLVQAELATQLANFDYSTIISKIAGTQISEKISQFEFDEQAINRQVNAAAGVIVNNINQTANNEIAALIGKQVSQINFDTQLKNSLVEVLEARFRDYAFPNDSIPAKSIKLSEVKLSGNQIKGGIIENFSSTGIDDRSTSCVITVLDQAVVVENNLVTLDLTVQGNLEVNGEVSKDSGFYKNLAASVSSQVQAELDDEFFGNYSRIIFDRIKTEGIELNKITSGGAAVIEGNRIGMGITESNLQKLGLLKELQVSGETAIAGTFYVGNKRVGINTLEPSAALAVWDAEVEITASKLQENVGIITTQRAQTLILGSNRNQNIVLNTDGSVQINNLQIGYMRFGSSESPPNYTSTKGHVVFNANPSPGGPLGWVCLGSANWANFGIID